jgi:hypothetical protein
MKMSINKRFYDISDENDNYLIHKSFELKISEDELVNRCVARMKMVNPICTDLNDSNKSECQCYSCLYD